MKTETINKTIEQSDVVLCVSHRAFRGCGICGGKMVFIRGKYPNEPRRKVCPTCLQERMDMIHDTSAKDYGIAYTDKHGG